MNKKAKELGCKNTNFINPHGYHDDNHYSTAYDMATIFRYCLNNETFKKIISTTQITVKAANSDNTLILKNSNRMLNPSYTNTYYQYVKGGKTGYTIEARGTFIGYAIKDDKTVIVGAFNGSQNINGYQGRFLDSKNLFNYVFDNYSKQLILKADDYVFQVYDKINKKYYTVKLENDIYGLVKELPNIEYAIDIDYTKFDLKNSDDTNIIGTIDLRYKFMDNNLNGHSISKENLILIDTETYYSFDYILKFLPLVIGILAIILIVLIIRFMKIKKKKNTKNI